MILQDELGILYTASDQQSLVEFNDCLDAYLSSNSTTMGRVNLLAEQDPGMPMALCFKAYLLKLAADPRMSGLLNAVIEQLQEQELNQREKLHLSAVRAWQNNLTNEALKYLSELLIDFPKDMLALRIAHYLYFYAGDAKGLRDSLAHSLRLWGHEERFFGYLLGMYSFGLEEAGDYELSESHGRSAIEINSNDIWAAHSVAHVMQMNGRFQEGIHWIDSQLPNWQNVNNFIYHLHWHQALFHLGQKDQSSALQIYDNILKAPLEDDFYLDICNATSLLWRLEMDGLDVGQRWHELANYSKERICDDELVFSTLHYLLAPARLQDSESTTSSLDHFANWGSKQTDQGKVCHEVGSRLASAIVHLGEKKFALAAEEIESIEDKIVLIGGSHAQRQLFQDLQYFSHISSKENA